MPEPAPRADEPTRTLPHGPAAAPARYAVGTAVGPYRLLELLGRGAFGEVWLAERESEIARARLAVKLPLHGHVNLDAIRQETEVWVRAGNHPNVLPMFEANIYDRQVVIVSEYAADGSLQDWLARHGGRAESVESAVDMTMGVLSGLEHLHVRGIVHRDLKPANILMQGGCPRIADFGLARHVETGATVSIASGTPPYMAPEAFKGMRSVQTDIWSVGVILYRLLSGGLPFPSGDLMELAVALATRPPAALPDAVPAAVRQVVSTAIDKNPDGRYRTAADMRAALRDALRQPEAKAAPDFVPRFGGRTVAVTGSMSADEYRAAQRVREVLPTYFGPETTWYCGAVGVADESAASFLLSEGQRVIAVGYTAVDLSPEMEEILSRHGAPFVDARNEPVSRVPGAPSTRDVFFATKADLIIVLWDGQSSGTRRLLDWLRELRRDHLVCYV